MSADPLPVVDLTPATNSEPDLLHELHRTVGLAEIHAAIHNHRTREES